MSKAASAWMPFYVGDYLGDTQRLTTEQHGAYLLLILDYWRAGPAPDDDAVLQQITKLTPSAWKKHRPALTRMFQITDGVWKHKRIDKELADATSNSERRSGKAKKAAQARWGDAPSNAPSMLQALPVECPPPSPSPSSVANATAADPEKIMFDSGVQLLTAAGKSPSAARTLLGKWKRDHSSAEVIEALGAAQRQGVIDPASWIEGRWHKRAKADQWVSPA